MIPFAEIPPALRDLPPSLVSHSSHHHDLSRFRGRDVTVVGGGQAALETAALLAEQGTRVRVLVRADRLSWNDVPPPWERPWWQSARAPHSGLGCGWRNWFYAERPGLFHRLPESTRTRVTATALGTAGAWWVRDRVEGAVEVLPGHEVASARPVRDGAGVQLEVVRRSGAEGAGLLAPLETDHVIAATGCTAGCDRLTLLSPELRAALTTTAAGSPRVASAFESSQAGLFLAGLITAPGFGPAMRFVQGAAYTAETLVRGGCGAGCGPGTWGRRCRRRGGGGAAGRRRVRATDGAREPGRGCRTFTVRHPAHYRRDAARPRRYRTTPPTIIAALAPEAASMASAPVWGSSGGGVWCPPGGGACSPPGGGVWSPPGGGV